jgi:hypothetical protein
MPSEMWCLAQSCTSVRHTNSVTLGADSIIPNNIKHAEPSTTHDGQQYSPIPQSCVRHTLHFSESAESFCWFNQPVTNVHSTVNLQSKNTSNYKHNPI